MTGNDRGRHQIGRVIFHEIDPVTKAVVTLKLGFTGIASPPLLQLMADKLAMRDQLLLSPFATKSLYVVLQQGV